MGSTQSSQSRGSGSTSDSARRLNRYSRAELKAKVFGNGSRDTSASNTTKDARRGRDGDKGTAETDYETPIYETKAAPAVPQNAVAQPAAAVRSIRVVAVPEPNTY